MPYALCPMPYARRSSVHLMLLRKAIYSHYLPTRKSDIKTITYWSFSKKADRTFTEFLNKIWGFSAESGRKVGREIAQESLPSIQQSAAEIAASYQCAKDRYDSKQQEFQQAEQQGILA